MVLAYRNALLRQPHKRNQSAEGTRCIAHARRKDRSDFSRAAEKSRGPFGICAEDEKPRAGPCGYATWLHPPFRFASGIPRKPFSNRDFGYLPRIFWSKSPISEGLRGSLHCRTERESLTTLAPPRMSERVSNGLEFPPVLNRLLSPSPSNLALPEKVNGDEDTGRFDSRATRSLSARSGNGLPSLQC